MYYVKASGGSKYTLVHTVAALYMLWVRTRNL